MRYDFRMKRLFGSGHKAYKKKKKKKKKKFTLHESIQKQIHVSNCFYNKSDILNVSSIIN